MKKLSIIMVLALLVSCNESINHSYHVDHQNGYTPWEDKGNVDWVNAMLSAMETEHIMRGDSVNLSPFYAIRCYLEEGCQRYFLSNGKYDFTLDGSPMTLIEIIERRGIMPFNSYSHNKDANIATIYNKVKKIADSALKSHAHKPPTPNATSYKSLAAKAQAVLDESLGYPPLHVFMLGAEYSPQEFARSVCAPNEYVMLTTKDIPVDSLLTITIKAVNGNHGVCWQANDKGCKAIIGLSHDDAGKRYIIMKDTNGLTNVSYDDFVEKTNAIVLPRDI